VYTKKGGRARAGVFDANEDTVFCRLDHRRKHKLFDFARGKSASSDVTITGSPATRGSRRKGSKEFGARVPGLIPIRQRCGKLKKKPGTNMLPIGGTD